MSDDIPFTIQEMQICYSSSHKISYIMKAIYFIYYLKHKEGLCLSPNSSDQYLDLCFKFS